VQSGQPYSRDHGPSIAGRIAAALLFAFIAAATATCGGSTAVETVVGPDAARCQTTLGGQQAPIPPDGGSVSVSVNAARDCTWTAASDVSWMQLNATSGQGSATLAVTIARNEVPSARTGAVTVNDQRFMVSQQPRPCTYEVRASSQSMSAEGGRGSIAVETLSGCSWTAASSAEWLRVESTTGSGAGSVSFEAVRNTGTAREASITIGGRSVTIAQSATSGPNPICTATVSPSTINAALAGTTQQVSVSIPAACDWSASTNGNSWVSVSPSSGRGNGSVTVTVSRNTGAARAATLTVGNQSLAVNQVAAPTCTATIDSGSASFGAGGGQGRVRVNTPDGCEWTVSNAPPWAPAAPDRGTGNGEVVYNVASNSSTSARSATLTIAGRGHQISQAGAAPTCTYTLQPTSQNFGAAATSGSFQVNTQDGCTWSASASGFVSTSSSGTGTGTVNFTVQQNTSTSSRQTTISVGGQSFTVMQDAAAPSCTYTLQPTSQNFGAAATSGSFQVNTQDGCTWSASASGFVSTSSSGTGTGTVNFTVQQNTSTSARQTTVSVGGQSFTVMQDAAAPSCTYTLQPTSQNFGAAATSGSFQVNTQNGCTWSASASGFVSTSSTGTGTGTVNFTVQQNTSTSSRQTTISVGGQSFTVMQDAAAPSCTYTLQPTSQNFGAGATSGSFQVNTQNGCTWSASASGFVSTSSSGTGTGTVNFTVQQNTSTSSRQTTISVGGQSFTVTQDAAAPSCTYTLQPTSQNFPASGGPGSFQVLAPAGCAWSASSNGFVTTSSSGSGNGTVSFTVQENTSTSSRQVVLNVQGQSFTVTQDAGSM
jgi:hypothetical protein